MGAVSSTPTQLAPMPADGVPKVQLRDLRKQFQVGSKQSNKSKQYTAEFKRDAVALALAPDKMPTEAARDLGVSAEGLRNWVNQATTRHGQGPGRPDQRGT